MSGLMQSWELQQKSGFIIVGFWASKPLSNMACSRVKKIMLPLFIIWTISFPGPLQFLRDKPENLINQSKPHNTSGDEFVKR
jgi:hypothetical protein